MTHGTVRRQQRRRRKGGFTEDDLLKGDNAKRVIDEEAGVVIYAVADGQGNGHGYGLTAIPIEKTDLEIEESED